jgi:hypothetical protein
MQNRNVPIGAVVIALLLAFLRLPPRTDVDDAASRSFLHKLKTIDIGGMVLIIGSVCCLLLAMQWGGQTMPWDAPRVVGLFVGAGVMLILFLILQYKLGSRATLPFEILLKRSISSGALYLFFFAMPTYVVSSVRTLDELACGVLTFKVRILPTDILPIGERLHCFEKRHRLSCSRPSTNCLHCAVGLACIALWVLRKADSFLQNNATLIFSEQAPYLIGGTIISIPGSYLLTLLDLDTTLGTWVAFFLVVAIGTGLSINHPYTAVQAVLSESEVPIGNGK